MLISRLGVSDLPSAIWTFVTGLLTVLAIVALAGCSSAQLATAQADISAGIQAACLDVNAAAALPGVNPSLKAYAGASCATASAVGALVQNSATLQWLGTLQGQMTATAKAG